MDYPPSLEEEEVYTTEALWASLPFANQALPSALQSHHITSGPTNEALLAHMPDVVLDEARISRAATLPEEILRVVFLWCAADWWEERDRETITSLSQVCALWRAAALGQSELWVDIRWDRWSAAKISRWIQRSATRALDVSVQSTSIDQAKWRHGEYQALVVLSSPRWTRLTFHLESPDAQRLSNNNDSLHGLLNSRLPQLQALSLMCSGELMPVDFSGYSLSALRSLTMTNAWPAPSSFINIGSQIISLTLAGLIGIDLGEWVRVIGACHHVKSLSMGLTQFTGDMLRLSRDVRYHITLPELRSI